MAVRAWTAMWRLTLVAGVVSLAPAAAAQGPDVSVTRRGGAHVTTEPGALVTFSFQVENRSASDRTVEGHAILPTDWRLVITEPPVMISSGGSDLRLLRVALPAHASAGEYAVHYVAGDGWSRDSVLVTVAARRRVTTRVREAPTFARAGEGYDVLFVVQNDGNAPADIHLAVSASAGIAARIDSGAIHLAAGREQLVRARVESGDGTSRAKAATVRLAAAIDGDTSRIEPAASVVQMVSRHGANASRFRRLPTQLTVRQVDRAERPILELRGAGALTASGTTQAQFLFRGLDQRASLFGDQDEYWVSLAAQRYQLRLGDRTAPYSRLGASWRPGVGAEGLLNLGGVRVGAYTQRDRRTRMPGREAERGGNVSVYPFGRLAMELHYVSRQGEHAGDVWTTRGQLTSWRAAAVDAEFGRGRDSAGGGAAYAVAITGSFPRASYALRRLVADRGFPGLARGAASSEAAATLIPLSGVSMSVSATDWSGLRPATLTSIATTRQRAVDGSLAWNRWLEAGYRWSIESRPGLASARERRGRAARLYLSLPAPLVTLRGGIETGTSVLTDAPLERIPFRRLSARASAGRGGNTIAAAVEWLTGAPLTSWTQDDHVRAALNASLPLTTGTRLTTALSMTSHRGEHPRRTMMLDLAVVQSLPSGQSASWRTRAISYGPGAPVVAPTHQAEYIVPFGLPVGSSGATGRVRARLVDRETGRPMEGVLLRIGDRVRLTTADGLASFEGLSEATYYLEVDRVAIDGQHVVVPGSMVAVSIRQGETRGIDLAITRGASVGGRLRRFDAQRSGLSPSAQAPTDGEATIPGAVLQLSNGQDSVRTSVDGGGQFRFTLVAPGHWVLSVVQADLPRYYRFEEDRVAIDLAAGDARQVELRVSQSAPRVQMIARAELSLDASGTAPSRLARVGGGHTRTGEGDAGNHEVPWQTGQRRLVPFPPAPAIPPDAPSTPPVTTKHRYTTTRWDRNLRQVARAIYGNSSLWPKIWLANLDQLRDPRALRPGLRLRIPDQAPLTAVERHAAEQFEARTP
jgi:hypothetical protein